MHMIWYHDAQTQGAVVTSSTILSSALSDIAARQKVWAYANHGLTIAAFLGLNANLNLLNKYLLGIYGFRSAALAPAFFALATHSPSVGLCMS